MARLEIQNLVKRFAAGAAPAVDGASLDAADGEILALLGPSGCGKTTTLRMVAGFEAPDAGSIAIGGRDIARLPPWGRDIDLVFQDYALFPHMTAADNIAYGLRRRGMPAAERAARVAEMLRLVRLEGLGARRPAALSGGQQQRVALARALAIRPGLLLLDEPLSNLDARLRQALQGELRAILAQVGTTTLVVTHDQDEAMALADRIAVMDRGRIVQLGTPREIHERPATRFVAEFVGRILWLDGQVQEGGQRFVTGAGLALRCRPPARVASRHGLAIRPERIRLPARPGDENRLPARVTALSYRGGESLVGVELSPGLALSLPVRSHEVDCAPGDVVELGIRAEDCVVVAEE
jgi:putative spermidine/putrescine transport system ATP-binding protein